MSDDMKLIVNGQARDLPTGTTLISLLEQFCRTPDHVIAEVNGAIIDRAAWVGTPLREGDKIELVAFVGGG